MKHGRRRALGGIFLMMAGLLAVLCRPDPQLWTGRPEDAILPRINSSPIAIDMLVATPMPSATPGLSKPSPSPVPSPKKSPEPKPSSSQPSSPIQGQLIFNVFYTLCGHYRISIESCDPLSDAMTLTIQYPQWSLSPFEDGFLLERTVDQLCPDHVLAQISGDELHIYANLDGGGDLTLILSIPLADAPFSLSDEALDALNQGLVLDNTEQLESYLESWDS